MEGISISNSKWCVSETYADHCIPCNLDLPDDVAGAVQLLEYSIALPNFVSNAKSLFDREKGDESAEEVHKLLQQALETQQALRKFDSYMPSKWGYRCVTTVSSVISEDEIDDLEAWPGPVHSYQDINVSSIRNNNRVNQMLCSSTVIDALEWLDPAGYTNDERYAAAQRRVQSLVDDICYRVPFHLWSQLVENKAGAEEYDRTSKQRRPSQHP